MSERLRQFEALLDAYVWAHNDLQNYPFNDVNRSEYELAAIEARAAVLLAFQPEAGGTIELERNVAEHLYGTTLEAGGRCHICKAYREAVDAKWPAARALHKPKIECLYTAWPECGCVEKCQYEPEPSPQVQRPK